MRRREFCKVAAGTAATIAWPFRARTETMRHIGILFGTSQELAKARGLLEVITQGLKENGWNEGQNFTFDYRFADGKYGVLPKLAAELVQARVDVILTDSSAATQAAKDATRSIPIAALSNDPIGSGFIASLNRPGGNITGISLVGADLSGRRLQLLSELVPGLGRIVILSNPAVSSHALILKQMRAAAQSLKMEIAVAEASTPDALDNAFAAITSSHAGALVVLPDAMFFGQHPRIVAFTLASRLPALFPETPVVAAGGLMAYGPNILASFKRLAFYADKILRGANPAELPVEEPTTFELAINLKTAKALGLTVPDKLLSTAEVVIE
jgi:putative ABC transport system substrate-binding protein